MISACCLSASCAEPKIEYRDVLPDIPKELRTTEKVPERELQTLTDVGIILTDHVQALDAANGKITAIDCIWRAAETGKPVCAQVYPVPSPQ